MPLRTITVDDEGKVYKKDRSDETYDIFLDCARWDRSCYERAAAMIREAKNTLWTIRVGRFADDTDLENVRLIAGAIRECVALRTVGLGVSRADHAEILVSAVVALPALMQFHPEQGTPFPEFTRIVMRVAREGNVARLDLSGENHHTPIDVGVLVRALSEDTKELGVEIHGSIVHGDKALVSLADLVRAIERGRGLVRIISLTCPFDSNMALFRAHKRSCENEKLMALFGAAGIVRPEQPPIAKFVRSDGDFAIAHRVAGFLVGD